MVVDGDGIPSFSLASLLHDSNNSQYGPVNSSYWIFKMKRMVHRLMIYNVW